MEHGIVDVEWRAGCTFAHFDGHNAVRVGGGGTASFARCNFTGNHIATSFADNAVVEADAGASHDTLVRLQQCAFAGTSPVPARLLSADNSARSTHGRFYSDGGEAVTVLSESNRRWQGSVAPLEDAPVRAGLMLTAADAELLAIQEVHTSNNSLYSRPIFFICNPTFRPNKCRIFIALGYLSLIHI